MGWWKNVKRIPDVLNRVQWLEAENKTCKKEIEKLKKVQSDIAKSLEDIVSFGEKVNDDRRNQVDLVKALTNQMAIQSDEEIDQKIDELRGIQQSIAASSAVGSEIVTKRRNERAIQTAIDQLEAKKSQVEVQSNATN
jgi:vacuolar-type H+-ATPase subunit I/STV1